jgi:hypothetical protein
MSKPIFRWTRHVLRLAGIHDDIVTPICEAHLTGHLERQTWMPATSAGDDGRGGIQIRSGHALEDRRRENH